MHAWIFLPTNLFIRIFPKNNRHLLLPNYDQGSCDRNHWEGWGSQRRPGPLRGEFGGVSGMGTAEDSEDSDTSSDLLDWGVGELLKGGRGVVVKREGTLNNPLTPANRTGLHKLEHIVWTILPWKGKVLDFFGGVLCFYFEFSVLHLDYTHHFLGLLWVQCGQ